MNPNDKYLRLVVYIERRRVAATEPYRATWAALKTQALRRWGAALRGRAR